MEFHRFIPSDKHCSFKNLLGHSRCPFRSTPIHSFSEHKHKQSICDDSEFGPHVFCGCHFRSYNSNCSNQAQLIFVRMTCETLLVFLMEHVVLLATPLFSIRLPFQFFPIFSVLSFGDCPFILMEKFFSSIKVTSKQINNYFLLKFHIYDVTLGRKPDAKI